MEPWGKGEEGFEEGNLICGCDGSSVENDSGYHDRRGKTKLLRLRYRSLLIRAS